MISGQARHYRITGLVQGVGFRPYVWRLARDLGLRGWVLNDAEGVQAHVQGGEGALAAFARRLPLEAPPLARIDAVTARPVPPGAFAEFAIRDSLPGAAQTAIGPDAAVCPDCVADLCDPDNRRWRYAFTTCTHCGPRYTVSSGIPYDRGRTSLAPFFLCPDCAREYTDPGDRRFHAETTACPRCGPQLSLVDFTGQPLPGDPVAEALALLQAGKIVALKGLGGFHLACDARNASAVAELRRRKQRDAKPFAVMALNRQSLPRGWVDEPREALLRSPAAPVVLLPVHGQKDENWSSILLNVAPLRYEQEPEISHESQSSSYSNGENFSPDIPNHLAHLGLMYPATPLHLLLWHQAAGQPAGTDWLVSNSEMVLVMTSANPGGEPLVIGNDEALARLGEIADALLWHNREILVRCDDSVLRLEADGPVTLRRARGYTPEPLDLGSDGPALLAFGGYFKNTLCLTRGREAFLSQHIGSLDNAATLGFGEETRDHLLRVLAIQPTAVAHDLHPDYPSTRQALGYAAVHDLPSLAVGHHHAHGAAVLAEYGHTGPALVLALDGVGLGPDGTAWGGELLRLEGSRCERLGHLAPLALPGGDKAAREPWRMAVAALHALGRGHQAPALVARHHGGRQVSTLLQMLDKGLNCPLTSSLGRLFDAAAGLLGVSTVQAYEAQAAMSLEALAWHHGPERPLAAGYTVAQGVLDFSPLLHWLADAGLSAQSPARGAAVFHATVAQGLATWAVAAAAEHPGLPLAWSGGCALNGRLSGLLQAHLADAGLTLLRPRRIPPNDGGLALGQAWIARQHYLENPTCA